eukprot:3442855-Amphidinium_carterae.2
MSSSETQQLKSNVSLTMARRCLSLDVLKVVDHGVKGNVLYHVHKRADVPKKLKFYHGNDYHDFHVVFETTDKGPIVKYR